MKSNNIQVGIDLGTTNSEIAINRDGMIEIVKNILGDEYTPSVFGVNKAKNIEVGKPAYQKLYGEESQHYKAEVKRIMGTSEKIHFSRLDKNMTAEEISAEILKSLKSDVLRKYPQFNTTSVVITVPAYFSTLQAEATKRAGNLSGFKYVVLLQEPIAAAMAYGFSNIKNETWLIYDLGGGTFDVAVISSKDEVLSVLGHNGDNFLGGKNFDWAIVDKIIVPHLLNEYSLKNFNRGNEDQKIQSMYAKLKRIAETAKIILSQETKTTLEVDIGQDDDGKDIYLNIDFTRDQFEKLIEPFITKTIDLSLDTIKEAGVKKNTISKIILVGGPTQIPYIKVKLREVLNVQVDSSVDPLTVVAKGACVYASGQRIPQELLEDENPKDLDTEKLSLNYESMTAETEVLVTGSINSLEDDGNDYYIQMQSESGYYNSPKIKLKKGKFFEKVLLEKTKTNLFWIYLFDSKGSSIQIYPDSLSITQGITIAGAPIPHTLGVKILDKGALIGGTNVEKFDKFFEKGDILPLKKTKSYSTARKLIKNDPVNKLLIKIIEGDSENPNNNDYICELGIKGDDLPYDLPEGTGIDVTININESRELGVEYYIPSIDKFGNARATVMDEIIDVDRLEQELSLQKDRLEKYQSSYTSEDRNKIYAEMESIAAGIKHGEVDEDEKRKASSDLKELKNKMAKLEKEKEMTQLIDDYHERYNIVDKSIDLLGDLKNKERYYEHLEILKKEGEKAIAAENKTFLIRIIEQLLELGLRIYYSDPQSWVSEFNNLKLGNHQFNNQKDAEYFLEKGNQAIQKNDTDELKRCVQNLFSLLSSDEQKKITNNIPGITTK